MGKVKGGAGAGLAAEVEKAALGGGSPTDVVQDSVLRSSSFSLGPNDKPCKPGLFCAGRLTSFCKSSGFQGRVALTTIGPERLGGLGTSRALLEPSHTLEAPTRLWPTWVPTFPLHRAHHDTRRRYSPVTVRPAAGKRPTILRHQALTH